MITKDGLQSNGIFSTYGHMVNQIPDFLDSQRDFTKTSLQGAANYYLWLDPKVKLVFLGQAPLVFRTAASGQASLTMGRRTWGASLKSYPIQKMTYTYHMVKSQKIGNHKNALHAHPW